MRDRLGFAQNVIVQGTCHGADNRALVDALVHSNGRARGVAAVQREISDDCPERLSAAGPQGLDGERHAYATSFRSRGASSRRSPTACCGEPIGRTPISPITCPTTAFSDFIPHIGVTGELRRLLVDNRCDCIGRMKKRDKRRETRSEIEIPPHLSLPSFDGMRLIYFARLTLTEGDNSDDESQHRHA